MHAKKKLGKKRLRVKSIGVRERLKNTASFPRKRNRRKGRGMQTALTTLRTLRQRGNGAGLAMVASAILPGLIDKLFE